MADRTREVEQGGLPAAWLDRLHGLEVPAILLSLEHRVLAANAAYVRRYGDGAAGRRCFAVSHGYDRPCDEEGETCPVRVCQLTGRTTHVVHEHLQPGGGVERCAIELVPLAGDDGEAAAYLEIIRPLVGSGRPPGAWPHGIVGCSSAIREVLAQVERVAPTDVPVLVLGETGTGKELVARAIHAASLRRERPFVPVECPALPGTLFESELFGHERGAFTGAVRQRQGLVGVAQGGTLFLDEVADLPLELQAKMLRLLEAGTYRRVGSARPLKADVRLVAATHDGFRDLIASGRFRADLYYRLAVFPIRLPPLRERPEDLPLLVEHFLAGTGLGVSEAALEHLLRWSWPGNVRELRNVLQRAALLARPGDVIRLEHLPPELLAAEDRPARPAAGGGPWPWGDEVRPLAWVRARYLAWAAERSGLTREELARRLGISTRTLYRYLAEGAGAAPPGGGSVRS